MKNVFKNMTENTSLDIKHALVMLNQYPIIQEVVSFPNLSSSVYRLSLHSAHKVPVSPAPGFPVQEHLLFMSDS